MAELLEWIIVGGGVQGVHLAVRLLGEASVPPERLRLVDPAPRLLDAWRRCTGNTGMRHLRSPAVHHLDLDPWSLLDFAGANRRGRGVERGLFIKPYLRPAVELFEEHCEQVIQDHGLAELHIQDRAVGLQLDCEGAELELASGERLRARRVLLALGGGRPRWPDWALALKQAGHPIRHVFEGDFVLRPENWPQQLAVVGGGISAAQVALRMARAGKQVQLISRHELREHQFDSDPGWIGPKNMRAFLATHDLDRRRAMIDEARHAGSLPPDVHKDLLRATLHGEVELLVGEPAELAPQAEGVLLATGFEGARPGGALVDQLVESHALPCAACGYPVVDDHLRWHPAVFVAGALAELELGPVARNIIGARKAADRIVALSEAS